MRLLTSAFTPGLLWLVLLLQGCSAWQVNSLADQLQAQGSEATLQALQDISPPERDRAQYLLDLGSLKFSTGDFSGSIQDLQQAKQIMRELQATSITETAAAAIVNETFRAYSGTPSERVLNHLLLGFNYLAEGDLDGARVEMLQSNILMEELAKTDSVSGQLASARFLAGIVYELGGEWDDAMISYRRAANIMQARQMAIPDALATSLLKTSLRQGFDEEYQDYTQQFGREAQAVEAGDGEIIVFYSDGVVSNIKEQKITLFNWQLGQVISIAVPHYPARNYTPRHLTLHVAGQYFTTSPLENIEVLARTDLDARMPGIIATTTARAVAKYYAVREAGNQNGWAGLAANIATLISEIADTRSWNMLPSSLQVARFTVPSGSLPGIIGFPVEAYTRQLEPASKGATVILIASSLSDNLHSYHQPH
jgi:hypothetical protein